MMKNDNEKVNQNNYDDEFVKGEIYGQGYKKAA